MERDRGSVRSLHTRWECLGLSRFVIETSEMDTPPAAERIDETFYDDPINLGDVALGDVLFPPRHRDQQLYGGARVDRSRNPIPPGNGSGSHTRTARRRVRLDDQRASTTGAVCVGSSRSLLVGCARNRCIISVQWSRSRNRSRGSRAKSANLGGFA